MSTPISELTQVIEQKLNDHASTLSEINKREVHKFKWLKVSIVEGVPENPSNLYSGKEIEVLPRGVLQFYEKIPNGSRNVQFRFWALKMKVRFDNNLEQFIVTEIGNFGAFN